ncbi:MAG: adenosylmethionine decarboxylase [Thermoprotei archaeon]|nr:adenosylmethionine decarboxylase [Thermoprotei archaeon]
MEVMTGRELGRHIIAEFIGCPPSVLDDIEVLKEELVKAAEIAGATVLGDAFHKFKPYGVTGVVIVGESHLSIHTWPEYGYAALDIFTCGNHVDPWKAYEVLKEVLKPKYVSVMELRRGVDVGIRNRQ